MDAGTVPLRALCDRVLVTGREWLDRELAAPFDEARFLAAFTGAARRVGKTPVAGHPELPRPLEVYTTDELARALLLIAAVEHSSEVEAIARVKRAYDEGENRERRAVLRALPFLPHAERHLSLAIEACRSSVLPIFEAIANDNEYPAKYFPEPNFNQMALKTAFVELPLAKILSLETRKNRDLDRMARDYAAEREAAHRPVPADLGLLYL